jgi:hypothetical protein
VGGWPQITERLLRERQAMSDEEFLEYVRGLLGALGSRELTDEHFELAITYPWERPPGSCLVTDAGVEYLAGMDPGRRRKLADEYLNEAAGRVPLLAYGANGSPERLALKLAHLPEADREALILAAELEGFDIGASAHPPVFMTMPATMFCSPGTVVRVAVLFLTLTQFTALWWTELSYRVGALSGVTLTTDVTEQPIERVIVFVSRFGAFCVDGAPVAMAALAARNRRSVALTQIEILDAAARMSLGDGCGARDLVRAAFEEPAAFIADHFASFQAASAKFESAHWAQLPVDQD